MYSVQFLILYRLLGQSHSIKELLNRLMETSPWPSLINATGKYEPTTFLELNNRGFIVKNAKFRWTDDLVDQLMKALKEIARNPDIVHVKDKFYWISHYRFDGMIPVKDIKRKVRELCNATIGQ